MNGFHRVAQSTDIIDDEPSTFQIEETYVAIVRTDGRLYAFEDECTHAECPLSFGFVVGGDIECDCHGARFDMATGEVTRPPALTAIRTFPVREADGDVHVRIDP